MTAPDPLEDLPAIKRELGELEGPPSPELLERFQTAVRELERERNAAHGRQKSAITRRLQHLQELGANHLAAAAAAAPEATDAAGFMTPAELAAAAGDTPTAERTMTEAMETAAAHPPRRSGADRRRRRQTEAAEPVRSTKDAVEMVLRESDGPMHVKQIATAVIDRNLAPGLQGKTPAATIGAQIVTEAKKPAGRFVKTDTATFDLRELNPRGRKTRPQQA